MISGVTRRALLDLFESYDPNPDLTVAGLLLGGQPERHRPLRWWGRLDEVEFMSRLYDLDNLPSSDERYPNCRGDIIQHCIANCDWEASWPLQDERFGLSTSDADLLRFLAETLHPEVRSDPDDVSRLLNTYNRLLRPDGAEIIRSGTISRRPVYAGGAAVPRNIQPSTLREAIGQAVRNNLTDCTLTELDELLVELEMTASEGPKPDQAARLLYDRLEAGLKEGSLASPGSSKAHYVIERLADCTLTELDELLVELEMAASAGRGSPPKNLIFASEGPKPDQAARLLYDRLEAGLNEPEREIMEAYRELLRTHGFDLPALIPQV